MIIAFDSLTGRISTIDGSPGMPVAAAVMWTSKLYPLEVVESLDVSAAFERSWLFQQPIDNLDVSVSLLSGVLQRTVGYQTANVGHEDLDVSVSLSSGILLQIVVSLDAGHEDLDSSVSVLSGILDQIVVSTDQNESLDVSVSLNGGTLA